jgi:hypothetical protein
VIAAGPAPEREYEENVDGERMNVLDYERARDTSASP